MKLWGNKKEANWAKKFKSPKKKILSAYLFYLFCVWNFSFLDAFSFKKSNILNFDFHNDSNSCYKDCTCSS